MLKLFALICLLFLFMVVVTLPVSSQSYPLNITINTTQDILTTYELDVLILESTMNHSHNYDSYISSDNDDAFFYDVGDLWGTARNIRNWNVDDAF